MRQPAAMDRDLQPGAAQPGPEVSSVQGQELFPGDPAEPEKRGHRGRGDVIRRPPGDIEECLLEHVGRIDPLPETVVDAQPDNVLQPFAVAAEQRKQSLAVPVLDASLELGHVIELVRHNLPPDGQGKV